MASDCAFSLKYGAELSSILIGSECKPLITVMNKTLVTILLFAGLILFILSPFAGLASLMLVVLVAALFSTISTLVQILISGGTKKEHHES